jgi:hypothetical protein
MYCFSFNFLFKFPVCIFSKVGRNQGFGTFSGCPTILHYHVRRSEAVARSPLILARLAAIVKPAVEKTLSLGAEVAGMARIRLANLAKIGNVV